MVEGDSAITFVGEAGSTTELELEDGSELDSTGAITEVGIDITSETEAGDVLDVGAGGKSEDGVGRDSIVF